MGLASGRGPNHPSCPTELGGGQYKQPCKALRDSSIKRPNYCTDGCKSRAGFTSRPRNTNRDAGNYSENGKSNSNNCAGKDQCSI
ncbi:MAG: hypothetical protein CYG59_25400, partial [Chloroflexi bacterium]